MDRSVIFRNSRDRDDFIRLLPEGISLSVKRGEALTEELGCVLLEASAKLEIKGVPESPESSTG